MFTLTRYYHIEQPRDFGENPLYRATELVESELLRCPDKLTNETQMRPLMQFSDTPFYCLTLKADWQEVPSTPTKAKKGQRKICEILDSSDSATSTPKKRKKRTKRSNTD